MFIYLSIDPGANLGITVNQIDDYGNKNILHSTTVDLTKYAELKYGEDIIPLHGLRRAKALACSDSILSFIRAWNPILVVSESPYMGKFPAAFSALVECLTAIQNAMYSYDRMMPFIVIDPATIKKAVGSKGNSGNKDIMRTVVSPLLDNHFIQSYWLDEHGIDSIAVGEAYYRLYITGNQ